MTVAEHVEMTRRAFTTFDPKRAFELLATFNIDKRRRVRALSKGMRTAVMVALAFARNAEILVLDEPTGGLDPVNQRHVLSLMINEAAKGNSVIFSSHQIGQVERAAEHIAVMDRGRLVLQGLVDDFKADRKIVEGIFPDVTFTLDGIANDSRVARADRTERIVRLLVTGGADEIADAAHQCRRDGRPRARSQSRRHLPLRRLACDGHNRRRGKGNLVMNYVEWLRVRNLLKIVAIILAILVVLAVILRISFSRYMSPEAWVAHYAMQRGTP